MRRFFLSVFVLGLITWGLPASAQQDCFGPSCSVRGAGTPVPGCNAITAIANVVNGSFTCNPASVVNGTATTAGRSILTIRDTISGSSATSNFLNITGAFPATLSAATSAIYATIAFDNDSQQQAVIRSVSTGTGAAANYTASLWGDSQNTGQVAMGGYFTASGAATTTYGVRSHVTAGGARVGGEFALGVTGSSAASAALIADNSSVAANIFEARDNGTAVLTVSDGGDVLFGSTPKWGFYTSGSNNHMQLGLAQLTFGSAYNVNDVILMREAAAILQLGVDVNGAAVAQTLKAHDGITGTDIAGANLTLAGGRGTGAGTAGNLRIQTAVPVTTGTTAQILADRELFVGKPRSVADNTATTLFTITLGDDTDGGGIVDFCSMATSATTDRQKTCGQIAFSGVDVTAGAGGETCAAAITGTNSTAVSVGALTVTAAATTGTDLCNIQITSDSSLNVAHIVRYSVRLHPSASTVVITPQ